MPLWRIEILCPRYMDINVGSKDLSKELIDFFEGRGRFEDRNAYVGMAASSIPGLFITYFEGLSEVEKKEMAHVITMAFLGKSKTLNSYLHEAKWLMIALCMNGFVGYFSAWQEDLEKEFNEAANVHRWLQATDQEADLKGPAYKGDWHYPLALWGVLYLLGSNRIELVYKNLLQNACSLSFRDALSVAREAYDDLLSGQ